MKLVQSRLTPSSDEFSDICQWLSKLPKDDMSLVTCENIASQASGFWSGDGPSPDEVCSSLSSLVSRSHINCAKVIIGIRRQDQMLASRYAQGAISKSWYSQENFEVLVKNIIEADGVCPGHQWLYYDDVLSSFTRRFQDNLFIYSMEELEKTPLKVLIRMAKFINVPEEVFASRVKTAKKKSKAIGEDRWPLAKGEAELFLSPSLKMRILDHFEHSNSIFWENISMSSVGCDRAF